MNWKNIEKDLPPKFTSVYIWPPCDLGDKHFTAEHLKNGEFEINFSIGGGYSDCYKPKVKAWALIEEPRFLRGE